MGLIAVWRESRQELVNYKRTAEINQSEQFGENRPKN